MSAVRNDADRERPITPPHDDSRVHDHLPNAWQNVLRAVEEMEYAERRVDEPLRSDLRFDGYCCRQCGAPLADAAVLRRSWRLIRSGEHIGSRGEFATVACGTCGETRRLLWTVQMAPYRRGQP